MPDQLIIPGGNVKTKATGEVEGYAILFDQPPDCVADFFDANTDLGIEDRRSLPLHFQHGRDSVVGPRRLGKLSFKVDQTGLFVSGRLDLNDEIQRRIYAQVVARGAMGFSSAATSHLVVRIPRDIDGAPAWYLKSWPVNEISLVDRACEPRAQALPLKCHCTNSLEATIDPSDLETRLMLQKLKTENFSAGGHILQLSQERAFCAMRSKHQTALDVLLSAKARHQRAELKRQHESLIRRLRPPQRLWDPVNRNYYFA